jgi:aminopeptidase
VRPMRDFSEETRRLADLVVGFGANVQPGQLVAVSSYIGKEELTREVTRAAYERGALFVDVLYFDPWVKRQRIALADEGTLDYRPPWLAQRLLYHSEEHAARISLSGPSAPDALDGLDAARAGRDSLPSIPEVSQVVNANTTNWSIAPAPTRAWAELVYPELASDDAYERLWDAIVHICRLDEADPVAAWEERMATMKNVASTLTGRRFDAIRLSGPGTDLTVGLLPSSIWHAADFTTVDGIQHFPNIPSEETFTTPDPARVDGHVTATKPLELYGSIVDGIRMEFEGGRAVKINADRGADALRAATSRDENACRLGEIALVDRHGRIGPLDTVFFDTLLDENAASHIALGSAYELAVGDPRELERINRSAIHVDFMIGSLELDVDGVLADGTVVPILRGGDWIS